MNEILDTMDVPKFRKELTSNNIRWLLRNLAIRNSNHPQFKQVCELLQKVKPQ